MDRQVRLLAAQALEGPERRGSGPCLREELPRRGPMRVSAEAGCHARLDQTVMDGALHALSVAALTPLSLGEWRRRGGPGLQIHGASMRSAVGHVPWSGPGVCEGIPPPVYGFVVVNPCGWLGVCMYVCVGRDEGGRDPHAERQRGGRASRPSTPPPPSPSRCHCLPTPVPHCCCRRLKQFTSWRDVEYLAFCCACSSGDAVRGAALPSPDRNHLLDEWSILGSCIDEGHPLHISSPPCTIC